MADQAERNAAARIAERLAEAGVEAPDSEAPDVMTEEDVAREDVAFNEALSSVVPSGEDTAVEETQPEAEQEDFELPNLDPKLPADLAEELEMPDWDDEPAETEGEDPEEDDDEYEDSDRVRALRAELLKERKRREWAEQKRTEAKREKWVEEATKYFPLSEYALSNIKATSRRGFLRDAKKAHDAVKPVAMRIAKQYADAHEAAKKAAIEEGREHATQAWGKPTVAPGGRQATTEQERSERVQKAKSLEERIKARIF